MYSSSSLDEKTEEWEVTGSKEQTTSASSGYNHSIICLLDESALQIKQKERPGTKMVSTEEKGEYLHRADLKPTLPAYSHLPSIVSLASPKNCHTGTSYVTSHFSKSLSSPKWQMLIPN